VPTLRIVGPGRAGRSFARALSDRGWSVVGFVGRDDDPSLAADGVDVCLIATPDSAIPTVAAAIKARPESVVLHASGGLGLDVLGAHPRRGSVHPLVPLADPERGAALLVGAWFAVSGDPVARDLVAALGGRALNVADPDRAAYHAAACIASNHVVALLADVERVGALAGVPLAAYLELVRATVANVAAHGPAAALTGPASRADWATVRRHLQALDSPEAGRYVALAQAAAELVGRSWPGDLAAEGALCS